jgi:hypothetical protein
MISLAPAPALIREAAHVARRAKCMHEKPARIIELPSVRGIPDEVQAIGERREMQ